MPRSPLDDLPTDRAALEALYRSGSAPEALVGSFDGRLLPFGAPPAVAGILPWRGKRFEGDVGYNRLAVVGDRFPFAVRRGRSIIDGQPCLILDYAARGNPPVVRRLVDELRRVGDGLYLGLGMARLHGRSRPWTWFALVRS